MAQEKQVSKIHSQGLTETEAAISELAQAIYTHVVIIWLGVYMDLLRMGVGMSQTLACSWVSYPMLVIWEMIP